MLEPINLSSTRIQQPEDTTLGNTYTLRMAFHAGRHPEMVRSVGCLLTLRGPITNVLAPTSWRSASENSFKWLARAVSSCRFRCVSVRQTYLFLWRTCDYRVVGRMHLSMMSQVCTYRLARRYIRYTLFSSCSAAESDAVSWGTESEIRQTIYQYINPALWTQVL